MKKIQRRTLLYRSKVEYADFCLNHVLGCAHGCMFPCYAMQMAKRWGKVKDYQDWITPRIVSNALELLDEEIPRYRDQIKTVHLCFTTDPFMYRYPEVKKLTLQILEKLHAHGIKASVLTKGFYPNDLQAAEKYGRDNLYGITLVSFSETFRKRFEPHAAPYAKRLESLKMLHEVGMKTWISMEPYPTPNFVKQDLGELLERVSFADRIVFGKWNYNPAVMQGEAGEEFYAKSSRTVIDFCEERGIDYHIKEGTPVAELVSPVLMHQKMSSAVPASL